MNVRALLLLAAALPVAGCVGVPDTEATIGPAEVRARDVSFNATPSASAGGAFTTADSIELGHPPIGMTGAIVEARPTGPFGRTPATTHRFWIVNKGEAIDEVAAPDANGVYRIVLPSANWTEGMLLLAHTAGRSADSAPAAAVRIQAAFTVFVNVTFDPA